MACVCVRSCACKINKVVCKSASGPTYLRSTLYFFGTAFFVFGCVDEIARNNSNACLLVCQEVFRVVGHVLLVDQMELPRASLNTFQTMYKVYPDGKQCKLTYKFCVNFCVTSVA